MLRRSCFSRFAAFRPTSLHLCAAASASTRRQLLQELRFRTEAPLNDCSKALKECNNEIDEAIVWLRKNGAAKVNKVAGRSAEHGALTAVIVKSSQQCNNKASASSADGTTSVHGFIVQVNSETDFASRGERFRKFAQESVQEKMNNLVKAKEAANSDWGKGFYADLAKGQTELAEELNEVIKSDLTDLIAVLRENVLVRNVYALPFFEPEANPKQSEDKPREDMQTTEVVGAYVHDTTAGFSDTGSIVGLSRLLFSPAAAEDEAAAAEALARRQQSHANDMAQHIVSRLGDNSPIGGQPYLYGESDMSTSQFLKRNRCLFRGSMVLKFSEGKLVMRRDTKEKLKEE